MATQQRALANQAAQAAQTGGGLDSFKPLSKYTTDETYVSRDTLACISAGYKGENGTPVISRNGEIFISDPEGRAPGLAARLKANNGRKLTIAMPSNNPADFISQSYRKEGRTRLEAYGDDTAITVIDADGTRVKHAAGTKGFEKLVAECKVSTNISFILAEYDRDGRPVYPFIDGLGLYRIRTTSHNTVDNLLACLRLIKNFTGGQVAGIPLEVSLTYRNVCDPKGAKRNVPLFIFTMKPPAGLVLSSKNFPEITAAATQAINMCAPVLALPAGSDIDEAIAEFNEPPPVLTTKQAHQLATGLDEAKERARFFAIAEGTPWEHKAGRAKFMAKFTEGDTDSLADFLATAAPDAADDMLDTLRACVERWQEDQAEEAERETAHVARHAPDTGEMIREPIDAEFMEVVETTPDPTPKTTREQVGKLWTILQSLHGDRAEAELGNYVTTCGVSRPGELFAWQVQHAIDHYGAKVVGREVAA